MRFEAAKVAKVEKRAGATGAGEACEETRQVDVGGNMKSYSSQVYGVPTG